MTESDSGRERKTYVVDTSILVSAPDALQNLTTSNTVVLPFPVLQELDRRRTATNGVGYTARSTVRFLDDTQSRASVDEMRSGIPLNGGLLKFHSGTLDLAAPGRASIPATPTTRSSCWPTTTSGSTPTSRSSS